MPCDVDDETRLEQRLEELITSGYVPADFYDDKPLTGLEFFEYVKRQQNDDSIEVKNNQFGQNCSSSDTDNTENHECDIVEIEEDEEIEKNGIGNIEQFEKSMWTRLALATHAVHMLHPSICSMNSEDVQTEGTKMVI